MERCRKCGGRIYLEPLDDTGEVDIVCIICGFRVVITDLYDNRELGVIVDTAHRNWKNQIETIKPIPDLRNSRRGKKR